MKNIFITGITKGLGNEIIRVLLKKDNNIYGLDICMDKELQRLKDEYPNRLNILKFNLCNTVQVKEKIFDEFLNLDIPIHGYVNNAAIAYDDIITNLQYKPLEKMFRINVFTPMMITKYVIRNMLYHHIRGSIVHLSSVSAHTGYKGLAMYASTKGALEAFSKNTAREWGTRGIHSNCIIAGFMETSMSETLSQEQKDRIYKRTSLKKPTKTNSVAETIAFLLTEKAESITGQNIFVDSGTI